MSDILDVFPSNVSYIGRDLRYRFVNHTFRRAVHLAQPGLDPVGLHPREVLPAALYEFLKPYHDRAFAGETVECLINKSRTPRGEDVKFMFIPNFVEGEVVGIYAIGFDVTEFEEARQKTLDELAQSEAQFKSVINTQTELITRWRPDDFVLTFANPAYVKYFERGSEDELLGTSLFDRLEPAYAEQLRKQATQIVETGQPQATEEKKLMPDGSTRYYQWTDSPIFDGNGEVIEIQGIGRDVTAEREAQRAIEELNDQLTVINDSLPMWIAIVDRDYRFRYLNQYHVELVGQEAYETAVGKTVAEMLGKQACKRAKPFYEKAFAGERVVHHGTAKLQGQEIQQSVQMFPQRTDGEDGEIEAVYVMVLNITALKQRHDGAAAGAVDLGLSTDSSLGLEDGRVANG